MERRNVVCIYTRIVAREKESQSKTRDAKVIPLSVETCYIYTYIEYV